MTPYKTFTMLNSTNIRFEDILTEAQSIPLTKGNYSIYLSSQNRSIRRKAFKSLYKSYKSLKQTFAELFIGKIKANYFLTKLQLYLYNDYLSKQFEHGLDKFHCKFILLITNTKSIEVLDVPLNEYEIRQSTELVDSIVEALYFSKDNKWKLKFKNSYNCKFCEYKGTEHCTNDTQEDFKVITEKEHVKVLKNDQPVDGKTLYIPWRDNLFIQQQQQPVDYMGDLRKLLKNRKNIYGESETRDTTEENKEDKNTAC